MTEPVSVAAVKTAPAMLAAIEAIERFMQSKIGASVRLTPTGELHDQTARELAEAIVRLAMAAGWALRPAWGICAYMDPIAPPVLNVRTVDPDGIEHALFDAEAWRPLSDYHAGMAD